MVGSGLRGEVISACTSIVTWRGTMGSKRMAFVGTCGVLIGGGVGVQQYGVGMVCKVRGPRTGRSRVVVRMSDEPDFGEEPVASQETLNAIDKEDEDLEKKRKENERLRAAERFIEIDEGAMECRNCGYVYEPKKGDRNLGVPEGIPFDELPLDMSCPGCNSPKISFISVKKVVAGFAENQQYGFGGNSLTEGQKSGLIFGGLAFFLVALLSGYLLN